ncbi:54S ribosomal protein L39, mitochondrial [Entophlyctis luteolus]|nr:54S ribosomal protein L39, mitochondrial [Entophlyctis luteolus]
MIEVWNRALELERDAHVQRLSSRVESPIEVQVRSLGEESQPPRLLTVLGKSSGITPLDVLGQAKAGLKISKDVVVALVDDIDGSDYLHPWDLRRPLERSCTLRFAGLKDVWEKTHEDSGGKVDPRVREAVLSTYWHSAAHLLGWAIQEQFGEEAFLDDGPSLKMQGRVGGGFYYDVLLVSGAKALVDLSFEDHLNALICSKHVFHASNSDLVDLEKKMNALAASKVAFERLSVPRTVAEDLFGHSPVKLSLLARIPQDSRISLYKCGDFIDLCRGPHIPHTGFLQSSKLLKTASATFSESLVSSLRTKPVNNSPLTRIYGICFPRPKLLTQWISDQSEALERDHRTIAKQQGLFFMHPMSPGSPMMLPHGTRIANRLIQHMRREYRRLGFQEIVTPLVFNKDLWVTSGHWQNYKDDMFMVIDGEKGSELKTKDSLDSAVDDSGIAAHDCFHEALQEEDVYGLKPMNCPGHCLVFANKSYSYKDLPVRFAEFSPLHRNEASGALSGLTRVRKFHQDDAHIFCTTDQIESEISGTLSLIKRIYGHLRFHEYKLALSTRPTKSIGTDEQWNAAEAALKRALDAATGGQGYLTKHGDGAFYGPKIDVMVVDAMGREHQTATIQLDFQLPSRFGLRYARGEPGGEGASFGTPVMIHRAVLGSIERIMAILAEHYAGRWPFWLSPRQAMVIPATSHPDIVAYAEAVSKALACGGLGWDAADIQKKIASGLTGDDVYNSVDSKKVESVFFHVDARLRDVDATLGKRIRDAWLSRYNFVIVVGAKELESGTLSVRMNADASEGACEGKKGDRDLGQRTVKEVITMWNELYPI